MRLWMSGIDMVAIAAEVLPPRWQKPLLREYRRVEDAIRREIGKQRERR